MNTRSNANSPETGMARWKDAEATPAVKREKLPSGKVVGAVANSIMILRYLSNAREPAGVTRIAKETKLNASTCFNILKTLTVEDFVSFDPLTKTYAISFGVLDVAWGATALGNDINTIRPLMDKIARDNGVTLTLWQPIGGNRMVLILSALTQSAIRIQMAVGQRLPKLVGAAGRCFAAFSELSEKELERRFEAMRWNRPFSFSEFREQVRETAEQGWALDEGYFATGTVSISVPILDDSGIAVMAATATIFANQLEPGQVEVIVRDLNQLSRRIKQIVVGT